MGNTSGSGGSKEEEWELAVSKREKRNNTRKRGRSGGKGRERGGGRKVGVREVILKRRIERNAGKSK